jgi:uncharacterized surface protein with fasciclin (FAS1) repeats
MQHTETDSFVEALANHFYMESYSKKKMGKRNVMQVSKYLFLWACLLASVPVWAQSEIAIFSNMVDAQEAVDPQELHERRMASIEKLVHALRQYKGMEGGKSFTLFVPNNEAFKKVPDGTLSYFTNTENKSALDELVTFHLIPEKLSKADLLARIKAAPSGKLSLKTVSGFYLRFTVDTKENITITNESGKEIHIMAYNWSKGNGLLHVVDSVISPFDHGMAERENPNVNVDLD